MNTSWKTTPQHRRMWDIFYFLPKWNILCEMSGKGRTWLEVEGWNRMINTTSFFLPCSDFVQFSGSRRGSLHHRLPGMFWNSRRNPRWVVVKLFNRWATINSKILTFLGKFMPLFYCNNFFSAFLKLKTKQKLEILFAVKHCHARNTTHLHGTRFGSSRRPRPPAFKRARSTVVFFFFSLLSHSLFRLHFPAIWPDIP